MQRNAGVSDRRSIHRSTLRNFQHADRQIDVTVQAYSCFVTPLLDVRDILQHIALQIEFVLQHDAVVADPAALIDPCPEAHCVTNMINRIS
jgi:hypothetical protein